MILMDEIVHISRIDMACDSGRREEPRLPARGGIYIGINEVQQGEVSKAGSTTPGTDAGVW
jgi:hypothetical protein